MIKKILAHRIVYGQIIVGQDGIDAHFKIAACLARVVRPEYVTANAVLVRLVDHALVEMRLEELYRESKLENPAIVIDCNHSNSAKQFRQQIRIAEEVMQNRRFDGDFKRIVKGFMIESFLVEGNQKHDEIFGKSITDPCLGWEDTERLLCNIADQV